MENQNFTGYICKSCKYSTTNKSYMKKHTLTKKHQNNLSKEVKLNDDELIVHSKNEFGALIRILPETN